MPIYEYRCSCCNRCFETLVLRSSDASPRCPQCGADKVERQLSAFACRSASPDASPPVCHQATSSACTGSSFS
jgi:putative FmdB family regulatory protein